jgi:hypothetical protein
MDRRGRHGPAGLPDRAARRPSDRARDDPPGTRQSVSVDDGRNWSPKRGALPTLDPLSRPPNVRLRFTEPVDFPARRRRLDPAHRLPGSKELGLLLRVKDPRAAARAFAGWEALRG